MPPTPSYPSQRAHVGDVLIIWSTGLGQMLPPVATGAGAPGVEPLARFPRARCWLTWANRFSNSASTWFRLRRHDPDSCGSLPGQHHGSVERPTGDNVPLYLELGNAMSNQVLVAIE